MAGQKLIPRFSTVEDGFKDPKTGMPIIGMQFTEIVENGNVEPNDEWALFRLTDDGFDCYKFGAELAASIMSTSIGGKPAVREIARFNTHEEAIEAREKLSQEEQWRTLIRSVRPKKK